MRVGQGFDVHPFSDDAARPLLLGGVQVPGAPGLSGHSDADIVLHTLADALLGACGQGDIGTLFGSDDPQYQGASSTVFVDGALERVASLGLKISNTDCTIVAQRPKIGPYRERITASVAEILGVDGSQVNIKATTTDGLGFTGRGEGIACLAVVLLT